ncbi:response regulator transcription factor [Alkalihalobacillus sp. NPDC078783]
MKKVLVIKNKWSLVKKIVSVLNQESGFTLTLHNENQGLQIAFEQDWDLILIDWDSLSMTGPEICKQIRAVHTTPIIIVSNLLTSKASIESLRSGADDYIRKPFAKEELVERVKAVLRRVDGFNSNSTSLLLFRDLTIDIQRKIVTKDGEPISLSQREYDLIHYLISHKNRILSREILLNKVWGFNVAVNSNVVDLYVGYLRKKLSCKKEDRYIQTIHGRGYSMVE